MRKIICRLRLNEVSRQWGRRPKLPPSASCSCISCSPTGARRVAKSGADQHQGRVPVRECPHHARPPTDLPVQLLDHVVGTDARPMLAGKIAVGQRFLNAVLIHGDRHQNSNFFVLSAPVAAQVDAVHVIFPHATGAASRDRNRTEIGKPRRKTGGAFGVLRKERDRISISAAGRISRAALPRARGRTRCVCGVRGFARGCAYAAPCTCGSPRQPQTGTDRRRRGSCP